MAKPRVTITLGSSGQKVVKESWSDYNGPRADASVLSGSKRSSSESFRSSGDHRFSNPKRMREDVSAKSYGDSRLDPKDLRLKLTRERVSKRVKLENENSKKMELHKKASRATESLESPNQNILRSVPSSRRAAETLQVGSMISPYVSWNSNAAKTRSPERIMKSSGGIFNPMSSIDQLPSRVTSMRLRDASREENLSMRDALDSSRPKIPGFATSRGFLDSAKMVAELPLATCGMSRPIHQVPKDSQPLTVCSLLNALGLGKYFINFQAEEIDMFALKQMRDVDLKELGIPMGPRKKIILALEARRRRPPAQLQAPRIVSS